MLSPLRQIVSGWRAEAGAQLGTSDRTAVRALSARSRTRSRQLACYLFPPEAAHTGSGLTSSAITYTFINNRQVAG